MLDAARLPRRLGLALAIAMISSPLLAADSPPMATVAGGRLAGIHDAKTGLNEFKGIPYAAPPIGSLRWKPPQPAVAWKDVRKAEHFGPRCMQRPIFSDMVFRSDGMSEDCLYLNVWTPAHDAGKKLPVLVYFYGGGFVGGDGSEPRYDGAGLAQRGIVTVIERQHAHPLAKRRRGRLHQRWIAIQAANQEDTLAPG